MIKKELRTNLKSFIIWTLIMICMYTVVFLVYPSMQIDASTMTQLLNAFPEALLKHFNMDIVGIDSVFGWIATEGFLMLTLIGSVYFSILGSNILLKEEEAGTIEFLYSKPISRFKIFVSKFLSGIFIILAFNFLISITVFIGLILSKELFIIKWLLISIIPIVIHLFFFSLSLFLSTLFKKNNQSIAVSMGWLFIMYLLNVFSAMSEKTEFLKYFSPFYYINARDVLLTESIELSNVLLVLFLSMVLSSGAYFIFNKKELV